MAGHGVAVWGSEVWRAAGIDWIDEQLPVAGIERPGEPEQPHLRPWATALRVPTSRGPVWLKACSPGTASEAGLYEVLARVAPDKVLVPLAVDTERAWILLPDGGRRDGRGREVRAAVLRRAAAGDRLSA